MVNWKQTKDTRSQEAPVLYNSYSSLRMLHLPSLELPPLRGLLFLVTEGKKRQIIYVCASLRDKQQIWVLSPLHITDYYYAFMPA